MEIKTNAAVTIWNIQYPQHPVEWSCSKHVLFKQKYPTDSSKNARIFYPVHVPALTAGLYVTLAGWWYEQKKGRKYKCSSYLSHSIMQVQLKVRKVRKLFGQGLLFWRTASSKITRINIRYCSLSSAPSNGPGCASLWKTATSLPSVVVKAHWQELQNGRWLSRAQMDHVVNVERRHETIRYSFQLSVFLESTYIQHCVQLSTELQ